MKSVTRCLLPAAVLYLAASLLFPLSASAGAPVGGTFPIAEWDEFEVSPAVAFSFSRNEYLAVWSNDRPGCDDIYGRRLASDGRPLTGRFSISAGCGHERRFPDVAYSATSDQYLVVWEDETTEGLTQGHGIRARRVSGAGVVLDANDIVIRDAGAPTWRAYTPAVAWASSVNKYLVVYEEVFAGGWYIDNRVLNTTGALEGNAVTISTDPTDTLANPDVSFNPTTGRHLVVWQQEEGDVQTIRGRMVESGGGTYGSELVVRDEDLSNSAPAVACLPAGAASGLFLVVWENHYSSTDHDIYGRTVGGNGVLGEVVDVAILGWSETGPDVAADAVANRYLVAWRTQKAVADEPVTAKSVTAAGFVQIIYDFIPASESGGIRVAAGRSGDFLLVWHDEPWWWWNTFVFGGLWGIRTDLPVVVR